MNCCLRSRSLIVLGIDKLLATWTHTYRWTFLLREGLSLTVPASIQSAASCSGDHLNWVPHLSLEVNLSRGWSHDLVFVVWRASLAWVQLSVLILGWKLLESQFIWVVITLYYIAVFFLYTLGWSVQLDLIVSGHSLSNLDAVADISHRYVSVSAQVAFSVKRRYSLPSVFENGILTTKVSLMVIVDVAKATRACVDGGSALYQRRAGFHGGWVHCRTQHGLFAGALWD